MQFQCTIMIKNEPDFQFLSLSLRAPETIDYRLSTIDYRLSTINYRLLTSDYRLSTIDY